MTIGPWPEWSTTAARERAKELRRQINRGEDPLAEKQQRMKDPTFGELAEAYFQTEAKDQKGLKEYRRLLTRDALPHWRNVRAADIARRDVIALIDRHNYDAEKRKAIEIWHARLTSILSGENKATANVVEFPA